MAKRDRNNSSNSSNSDRDRHRDDDVRDPGGPEARGDAFDDDLARDNRRGHEGQGMSELARDTRSGMGGSPEADDRHGWRSHARQGQAESPVELTHNEPPKRKEGHR